MHVSVDDLLNYMDACGIDIAVVLPIQKIQGIGEDLWLTEDILRACRSHPDRICQDLRMPLLIEIGDLYNFGFDSFASVTSRFPVLTFLPGRNPRSRIIAPNFSEEMS